MADAGAADTALVRNGRVGWSPGALPWRPGADVDPSQRILLIDSGRDSLAPLELVSYDVGAVTHHARTIADALRYALKYCYDALLVDAGSSGETPIALLEQLRSLQPTAGILLCGEGLRFPEGFTLGGNLLGSFRTPWDRHEMATALRRAFELSRARRTPRPRFPAVRVSFERVLLIANATDFRRVERMTRLWFMPGGLVHATSLEEALLLLSQQNFDLVLTELALPDACGLDPVVRIRRLSEQIAIVVLTSVEDSALLDQVLQAGAQDVLLKPEVDRKLLFRSMCHSRLRQRAQLQLNHGALHDELTSLAKRTLLQQRISNALARSRRVGNTFAVMYIDLDHFKCINDTYGHDVGDAVLVAVSQRLKSAVREYDTVARLGGDEFAILLDSIEQPGEAETVAQRVLASLMPPVQVNQREIDVTASMGISVFPDGGSGADDLLRNADQAMYSAKRAGRNTYSITPPVESRELAPPISARRSVPAATGSSSIPAVSGISAVSSSYPSRVANDALDD